MRRQTQSWVASPLGRNSLLALFKNNDKQNVSKYQQIQKTLRNKQNVKTCNKIFHSDTSNVKDNLSSIADVERVDFQNIQSAFTSWLLKHTTFEGLTTTFLSTKEALLLANISNFTDKWNCSEKRGSIMKIYNSFSYTEDIKYEASLLELPMHDEEFKLVILVPNEADVLNDLFKKLTSDGLTAATGCITPLFTSVCELNAPNIEFISTSNKIQESVNSMTLTATEFGNVKINEEGVSIKVLTCFSSNIQAEVSTVTKPEKAHKPFYFAIIFKDMPLFTGYFENLNK
ncbi:antitrypsin-like isoform X2 [Maniola jurtina]|uniref:antitrypsin-like isoform X2 n=1 Tax=Maniola jurtina TaxID=191418 RepID=UPI001E689BF7|nr:antitrypsin-like isoform X2 [Maniola jurtina]